jgi:RNA polymerase sigma-70 factor (ECF subfamily)
MSKLKGFQQAISPDVIQLAQMGDMLAFEEIYQIYSKASYNLALKITGNETLAKDIVQEAFIKVMNKIIDFKYKGSFAGWLRRIVVYETIDRIKSEQKLHLVTENEFFEIESNDLFDYDWLSACIDLDILLKELTVTSRTVLLLHAVEGYKHKEIANFFGKSESFSKITLNRAYASLRKTALKQEKQHAFKR